MNSKEVRAHFLNFFQQKGHQIVPSAPLVAKDDPTLMFINAGMNPFKDYFLGNRDAEHPRIANTQRCLRVSGKHNDLEEVGRDSYHHTMFEMLGNWSFGDYFKKEAINWAWELLTEVYKLPIDRLYVTYFGGDEVENLEADTEALALWQQFVKPDNILPGNKKDNFWEMGDTGPCGPCSEIHIDLRPDSLRTEINGAELVNQDHPQVVEIWNLVFMQFNCRSDGSLHALPNKHVDTGMGLERLCMAMQGKLSNYETDLFSKHIEQLEGFTGIKYTNSYASDAFSDIAMRVIADHLRAVCFAVADGQLPSNNGAGYVIRRILRRAVRYYFSFLNQSQPLLYKLIPGLAHQFETVFPELKAQQEFVIKVVTEEEKTFLRTLESGLKRIEQIQIDPGAQLNGEIAFELYDTYGFPLDLTLLIASEKGWQVDVPGFKDALENQRNRSRKDAEKATGDWTDVHGGRNTMFSGYDATQLSDVKILAYRLLEKNAIKKYQILLNQTPFYPEGGGQLGDTGWLKDNSGKRTPIINTFRENDLIVHEVNELPEDPTGKFTAEVDADRRGLITANHSATHLLHAALQEVLGSHVEQRGSLVHPEYLRFDFSHFSKLSDAEVAQIEEIVNSRIAENIALGEARNLPIEAAKAAGAKMLFGEKYGETVRMISFDENFSVELCGGCHVRATGEIGWFKIKHEGAIAAGIRRIEALTGAAARKYIYGELEVLNNTRNLLKQPANVPAAIEQLQDENKQLKQQLEVLLQKEARMTGQSLEGAIETLADYKFLVANVPLKDAKSVKDMVFSLKDKHPNLMGVITATINDKPNITVFAGEEAVSTGKFHAGTLIRELASIIKGGGGGQPFFATAGGKDASALPKVLEVAKDRIMQHISSL